MQLHAFFTGTVHTLTTHKYKQAPQKTVSLCHLG